MVWQHLSCAHAGPARESQPVRRCFHPQLTGLKLVAPDQCDGCCYRGSDAATLADESSRFQVACVHLAARIDDEDGTHESDAVHVCLNPAHGQTTQRQCADCSDYLFPFLSPRMPAEMAARLLKLGSRSHPDGWWTWPNVQAGFRHLMDDAIKETSPPPADLSGRGIVIVGGGEYLASAYVTLRVLRHVGCRLPVQLWHLADEVSAADRRLLAQYECTCIDGAEHARSHNFQLHATWWKGWQLKAYAIAHSSFREVLYLDADSYPTRNPELLFDEPSYKSRGAIFWPDLDCAAGYLPAHLPEVFGAPRFLDLPCESGQLLIDKQRCWRELQLALFLNRHADYTYRLLFGDKDTFPIAWRRLGRDYARLWPMASATPQAILQHDSQGRVLFQHRVRDKFRLPAAQFPANPQNHPGHQYNPRLAHEDFCFRALEEFTQYKHHGSSQLPVIASVASPLRVLQVCPTANQACGVGNFAVNLERALRKQGVQIKTVKELPPATTDIVLIQHEHGIFDAERFGEQLARCSARKVLFAHSAGVERFGEQVNGFLCMAPGMVKSQLPVYELPHPANVDRTSPAQVKRELNMTGYQRVLGTCGFLTPDRELEPLVERLLPAAENFNWLIYLCCARHARHEQHSSYQALEQRLAARTGPHMRLQSQFFSTAQQARRLKALDLAWCWTRVPSRPYASGTASDLYGAGARLIVQEKEQHSAVLGRENIIALRSNDPHDLADLLIAEAQQPLKRHDPADLSWNSAAHNLINFLRTVLT